MTVVSHRGLVGQIVRLDEHWADVMLITHPRSHIKSRVDRTHATGMVSGLPSGELLMEHIPQNRDSLTPNVQVGDLVETSGLSDRFPGQITIGQVILVKQNDAAESQEALIRPSVDFDALELVMVVTAWRPSPEAQAAPAGDDDLGESPVGDPPPGDASP
jgi:rod shape-determining protein MreC